MVYSTGQLRPFLNPASNLISTLAISPSPCAQHTGSFTLLPIIHPDSTLKLNPNPYPNPNRNLDADRSASPYSRTLFYRSPHTSPIISHARTRHLVLLKSEMEAMMNNRHHNGTTCSCSELRGESNAAKEVVEDLSEASDMIEATRGDEWELCLPSYGSITTR